MIERPAEHDGAPSHERSRRAGYSIFAALLALLLVSLFSVSNGQLTIPLGVTVAATVKGLLGHGHALESLDSIVWNLRIPRVLAAVMVGGALGASGAAMQGLFRNPLADPYLLGVASGASLGATVAWMLLGSLGPAFAEIPFSIRGTPNLVPLCAFVGAVGAVALTLTLSGLRDHSENSVLLSGVVIGSILTSFSTYLMLRDADRTRAVFSWTLGNLSFAGWDGLTTVAPYAATGVGLLLVLARPLDVMQLGDDTARTMGVPVRRVKLGIIIGASLATAAAVAFVGLIGFVGLVAPHIMRRLATPRHRELIIASTLGGAVLLVLADLGARLLARPAELPVGIVTTLIGGPFFLWLLRRSG